VDFHNDFMAYELQRLQLANRIHLQMLRERRQGIDVKRMLERPLYASEVLRACEQGESEHLPLLAAHWRLHEDMPLPRSLAMVDVDLGRL